jgi:NtrC-family two-component system sensor histidine kinase KinB
MTENFTLINANPELDNLVNHICQMAISLTGGHRAAVYLAGQTSETLELAASVGLSERFTQQAEAAEAHMLSEKQASPDGRAQPLFTDLTQIKTGSSQLETLLLDEGVKSALIMPVEVDGQPVGMLSLYYDQLVEVDPRDLEVLRILADQIGLTVRNSWLRQEVDLHRQEMALLQDVGACVGDSLSLMAVLQSVAEAMVSVFPVDSWTVLLLASDSESLEVGSRLVFDGVDYQAEIVEAGPYPLAKMPAVAQVLETGGGVALQRHTKSLQAGEKRLLDDLHAPMGIILPLATAECVFGVLVAGSRLSYAEIQGPHMQFAQALSRYVAVASYHIERFEQLEDELAKRLEEQQTFKKILQRITRKLDFQDTIEQVITEAANATGAEMCEVALLKEHRQVLQVSARCVSGSWDTGDEWPAGSGITGRALRLGQAVVVEDVSLEPEYIPSGAQIGSELAVPIIVDDRRLGVINLESVRPNAFHSEHVRLVCRLADYAAIAINNARLFETIQQRADEFSALQAIAVELISSENVKQTLDVIARKALEHVQAHDVHIYLYDNQTDRLKFGASIWNTGEVDQEAVTPRPDGLTATTARLGQTQIVTDPLNHPLYADSRDMPGHDLPKASIPIRHGNQTIGVFNVSFDKQATISDDTVYFLELLAVQAAVAIANARLVEQTGNSRDRLQAILDSIRDGIVMVGMDRCVVLTSPRADYLLNVRGDDFIGKPFIWFLKHLLKVLDIEDTHAAFEEIREIRNSLRENPNRITRRNYIVNQPEVRAIEEVSLPVIGDSGELMGRLLIFRDVSQEHEMEVFRTEMSHMLVHDLRSPLGGVITGLHMVTDELVSPPDSIDLDMIESTVEVTLSSANSLLRLVNSILDINKLESGEVPLMLESIDLRELINETCRTLEGIAVEADIAIEVSIPDDLPSIVADYDKIERVVINLLDNALRYAPTGGHVRVYVESTAAYQEVCVADNGDGIPPQYRERIFERFFQVDQRHRKRGGKGSGLGLAFAKLAIEAHGGRIWVEEGPEGGAAFHFVIPTGLTPFRDQMIGSEQETE